MEKIQKVWFKERNIPKFSEYLSDNEKLIIFCRDVMLINMHDVPKVSATRSWLYTEDGRPKLKAICKAIASCINLCSKRATEFSYSQLTASYMTTETSGSLIHSSLNKAHVLKADTVLSFFKWHFHSLNDVIYCFISQKIDHS